MKTRPLIAISALALLAGCGSTGAPTATPANSTPAAAAANTYTQPPVTSNIGAPPRPKTQATKPKHRTPYAGDPLARRIYNDAKSVCEYLRVGPHWSMERALRTVQRDQYKLPQVAAAGCIAAYRH